MLDVIKIHTQYSICSVCTFKSMLFFEVRSHPSGLYVIPNRITYTYLRSNLLIRFHQAKKLKKKKQHPEEEEMSDSKNQNTPKVLIYGHRGWIGSQFVNHMKAHSSKPSFVLGNSRYVSRFHITSTHHTFTHSLTLTHTHTESTIQSLY